MPKPVYNDMQEYVDLTSKISKITNEISDLSNTSSSTSNKSDRKSRRNQSVHYEVKQLKSLMSNSNESFPSLHQPLVNHSKNNAKDNTISSSETT